MCPTKEWYWEDGSLFDGNDNFLVSSFAEDGSEGMAPGSDTAQYANLLRAAPKLLAACKLAWPVLRDQHAALAPVLHGGVCPDREAMFAIEAAIADVEGKGEDPKNHSRGEPVGTCGCRLVRTETGLKMMDCPLHASADALLAACRAVVASWEHGDLSAAARLCAAAVVSAKPEGGMTDA